MIKRYFVENCISIRQWAKKYNLPQRMTYAVINGDVFGKYNTANGSAKRVFEALLAEGIIKELPEGLRQGNNEEKAS